MINYKPTIIPLSHKNIGQGLILLDTQHEWSCYPFFEAQEQCDLVKRITNSPPRHKAVCFQVPALYRSYMGTPALQTLNNLGFLGWYSLFSSLSTELGCNQSGSEKEKSRVIDSLLFRQLRISHKVYFKFIKYSFLPFLLHFFLLFT